MEFQQVSVEDEEVAGGKNAHQIEVEQVGGLEELLRTGVQSEEGRVEEQTLEERRILLWTREQQAAEKRRVVRGTEEPRMERDQLFQKKRVRSRLHAVDRDEEWRETQFVLSKREYRQQVLE